MRVCWTYTNICCSSLSCTSLWLASSAPPSQLLQLINFVSWYDGYPIHPTYLVWYIERLGSLYNLVGLRLVGGEDRAHS